MVRHHAIRQHPATAEIFIPSHKNAELLTFLIVKHKLAIHHTRNAMINRRFFHRVLIICQPPRASHFSTIQGFYEKARFIFAKFRQSVCPHASFFQSPCQYPCMSHASQQPRIRTFCKKMCLTTRFSYTPQSYGNMMKNAAPIHRMVSFTLCGSAVTESFPLWQK